MPPHPFAYKSSLRSGMYGYSSTRRDGAQLVIVDYDFAGLDYKRTGGAASLSVSTHTSQNAKTGDGGDLQGYGIGRKATCPCYALALS